MKKLLLLLLLLYPMSAAADTYQWTDDSGTVNFSEDLGKVPKKFRKKARKLGSEESVAPAATGGESQAAPPITDTPKSAKKLYGGRDAAAWRKDFGQAIAKLEGAESELATLKGRLGDTSKMSRSEFLTIQNSIRHGETRVQELQKKLDLLKETADRQGVPPEFRQ